MLSWELNSGHVPIEIHIKRQDREHRIAINWVPLINRSQQIEGFLLGFRDVTERRQLEAKVREDKLKSDRLTNILRELAQTDRKRASDLVAQVIEVLAPEWESPSSRVLSNDFKRHIHTHKGVARSLGL
ncbi:MAG TPA: hypothetical protein VE954_03360 [Oligoflexus sp.]|uniref:hypothetical protein n=1 Tax=Oligoflexus sp. TaxID=1971216 RepID=UPI002D4CDCA4|nr:hypothetical protein [Oligoflexus sp.]HYX32125.1 hypothetical protein [Oligoflexus sp.]